MLKAFVVILPFTVPSAFVNTIWVWVCPDKFPCAFYKILGVVDVSVVPPSISILSCAVIKL